MFICICMKNTLSYVLSTRREKNHLTLGQLLGTHGCNYVAITTSIKGLHHFESANCKLLLTIFLEKS